MLFSSCFNISSIKNLFVSVFSHRQMALKVIPGNPSIQSWPQLPARIKTRIMKERYAHTFDSYMPNFMQYCCAGINFTDISYTYPKICFTPSISWNIRGVFLMMFCINSAGTQVVSANGMRRMRRSSLKAIRWVSVTYYKYQMCLTITVFGANSYCK